MITDDGRLVPDGGPILHTHPSWCAHNWPHRGLECSAVHRIDCACKPKLKPRVTISASELAARYGVNEKTPSRWCKAGRLGPEGVAWFRTPGGHLRFWLDKIEERERAAGGVAAGTYLNPEVK